MTSQLTHKKIAQEDISLSDVIVDVSSLQSFLESFPLHGTNLYQTVFKRNADIVQTQKEHLAVVNLEKILKATFAVSSESGFDRMSLRDLSRQTGMSMGAIYSCINKKEDIALMIADVVRLSSNLTYQYSRRSTTAWSQIEQSIRFHLLASTVLQPWYFFLFFETRSLPEDQQQASKQIELGAIQNFQDSINKGVKAGEFSVDDSYMVANTIVVLLEDWYLKPWKTQALSNKQNKQGSAPELKEQNINNYSQLILKLLKQLLSVSK